MISLLVHRDVVVARYEHTLSLAHMDFLRTVVKDHLSGIHIIERILTRAVDATAYVIIEEAVEHVVVVEYQLHRAEILISIYCHSRVFV